MGNERWASRRRLRYLWGPVGGSQQNHLIIVSHARRDFGFLSSSSPVVKASQLGRKMGIYLRSGRTPQTAQKSRFWRWPVWRRVGSVWDIAPSAIPLRFQPRSSIPYQGRAVACDKIKGSAARWDSPPLLFVLFLIFQSRVPPSIHPLCKVPLILIPLSYTCDKSRLWMGDAPS